MGSSLDALAEPLRSAVRSLVAEAGPGRVTWTSTRRTAAEQAALRVRNGCPSDPRAPASSCRVPTAPVGSSAHERGLAIDFTNTPAVLAEVARLAPKHKLHRTVVGEPWHYEHTATSGATAVDAIAEGGKGVGVADLAHVAAGAVTNPMAALGAALGPIGDVFALLGDGALWLRVVQVLAGGLLVALGLVIVGRDLAPSKLAAGAVAKVAGR